jgi:hypothetical protein
MTMTHAATSIATPLVAAGGLVAAAVYTAPEWLLIIGGLVTLVAAIGGVIVNVIMAVKTKTVVDAIHATTTGAQTTTNDTLAEAKVITGHVNSQASLQNAKIDALQKDLELFKTIVADMKQAAALLAQKAATTEAVTVAAGTKISQ